MDQENDRHRNRSAGGTGERSVATGIIAGVMAGIIFVIDALAPTGYALSFLYLLPLYIALQVPRRAVFPVALTTVAVLSAAALFLKPHLLPVYVSVFNRVVTVLLGASLGLFVMRRNAYLAAARLSQKRYAALFNTRSNGIVHWKVVADEQGRPVDLRFLQVNRAYEKIIGLKKEQVEGKLMTEVFPGIEKASQDYIGKYGDIALNGGELVWEDYFEPSRTWVSDYAYSPLPGEVTVLFTDITARKNAEHELERSRYWFERVTTTTPDIIFVLDIERNRNVYSNRSLLHLLGYTEEEFKRYENILQQVIYPEDLARVGAFYRAMKDAKPGEVRTLKHRALHKNGGVRWLEISASPFELDKEGHVSEVIGISRDITDRVLAEEGLRESEALLNAFFINTPVALLIYDNENRYVRINGFAAKLYGLRPEDSVGKNIYDVLPADLARETEQRNREVLEKDRPVVIGVYSAMMPLHSSEAKLTYWQGARFPVPLTGGRTGVGVFALDVTERMKAEEALRSREEELRSITENSPDVIARFDRELRHIFINPYGEKVYGRPRAEIIGKTNAELGMPADKVSFLKRHFEEVLSTGKQRSVEFDFDSPNLGHQYFLSVFVPEFNGRGEVRSVIAITRDVTQIKVAQKHLAEAVSEAGRRAEEAEEGRRILDALMDNIPEGIMITDEQGKIRSISRYLAEISGHAKDTVVGGSYRTVDELLKEPSVLAERRGPERADGRNPGTATAVAEAPLGLQYPLTRALEKGEVTVSEERRVYLPDGSVHTAVLNAAPVRDENARIVGAVTSWRDITDRKKAEEAMLSSNRELEQFAYVASHDLQEPLRMVASFTELLERRYHDQFDDRGRKYMRYIVDGAARMQNLIQDLLTYSRIGRLDTERRRIDLNSVVDNVVIDLSELIRETKAEVTHDPLPSLHANESAMGRLFMNLIGNALKFSRKDVPPKVHVATQRRGNEWRFAVSDNGIGIDPKYFDKIFVIFQRLHSREEYPGTGMGLAICKKIVENYGGRIWVESEQGKGTTFHFTIPQ